MNGGEQLNEPCAAMPRMRSFIFFASCILVTLVVQQLFFDGIPHVTDETSHWFQAKLFSQGRFSAEVPPCPEHFFQHNVVMTTDGRWFSKYPPGQALWLTLGIWLGSPQVMMPLVSGLGLLAFISLVRIFYDERTAFWSGIAWVISPQIILLSASYMSHMTCLTSVLWACLCLVKSCRHIKRMPSFGWALLSGLCWGFAVLIRPQDAFLSALVIFLILIWTKKRWQDWIALLSTLAIGALPALAFLIYRNQNLFGNPWALGYYLPPDSLIYPMIKDTFGFTQQHTPVRAATFFLWSMYRLNFAVLGWPVSVLGLFFVCLDRKFSRSNIWLIISLFPSIIFYFMHSYYGFEYEARYYLFMVPPLIVLSIRGIIVAFQRCDEWTIRWPAYALQVVLVLSVAFALVYYWPVRLMREYKGGYQQADAELHRKVLEEGLQNALVLIPSGNIHHDFRYSSGFIYNDPDLAGSVIYARDTAEDSVCLEQHFGHRSFYRGVHSGMGWQVLPLSPSGLLREREDL
jgi:4-amino-4-deoxy-L-arabinose transferase-like glycosyltransferase